MTEQLDRSDFGQSLLPNGGKITWDGSPEVSGPPQPGAPITRFVQPSPGMAFYVQIDRLEVPPPTFERQVDERDGAVTYVQTSPDPDPKMDLRSTWHKVVRVEDRGFVHDENPGAGRVVLEGQRTIWTGCGQTVHNDPRDRLAQVSWKGRLNEAPSDPWSFKTRCHRAGCWPVRKKE